VKAVHDLVRGLLSAVALGPLLLCLLVTAGFGPAGGDEGAGSIRVLYAGSLILPFAEIQKQFEAAHPDIKIDSEAHGSIQVLRHVSDIHERADVLISADSQLIPLLLYAGEDPDTGKPYGSWRIDFATNQMAVAYTDRSRYAEEITPDDWYEIITRPDVRLGIADPRLDANGYRALMMLKLAEESYGRPTLFFDAFDGQFTSPVTVEDEEGQSVIHVPELFETKSGARIVVRPYSVQLLPLLESGEIDYAIEYLSVIEQHGLRYVDLPPEVDLGDEALADLYAKVRVDLDYQRFATVKPSFQGQVITYSLTIPSNSARPQAAAEFIAFMLGPEGRGIMEQYHQPMLVPPRCDNLEAVPDELKVLVTPSS
jgi:molybdate/tungstate transport system substrate-binding protein